MGRGAEVRGRGPVPTRLPCPSFPKPEARAEIRAVERGGLEAALLVGVLPGQE